MHIPHDYLYHRYQKEHELQKMWAQRERERESSIRATEVVNESIHRISWFVRHNFNSHHCCFWRLLLFYNTVEEFELEESDVRFIEAFVSLTVGVKTTDWNLLFKLFQFLLLLSVMTVAVAVAVAWGTRRPLT